MEILQGLNAQQLEAVKKCDRHLLVVAGAGSGKTRVLTRKIAYLIQELQIPPSQILAMTFSNKAAQEMKERIEKLLPGYDNPHWIGTFHSVCLRILREFGSHLDLDPNFSIYDTSDQNAAIKQALKDLNLDPKKVSAKAIAHYIDQAKNEDTDIFDALERQFDLPDHITQCVRRYQDILKQNQALDFGDLLNRAVELIEKEPQVRSHLQSRWTRILVDEYQDTNAIQKRLIELLTLDSNNVLCAVGDEDQSIYGWRGARVENMVEFQSDFSQAETVKLEQNYRSTQAILEAANHVISHNLGRREKNLWSDLGAGKIPEYFRGEDDYQEAQYVLDRTQELLSQGVPAHEIAIFYRTHAQSRLLEEACRRRNQNYRVLGGTRFFDRKEIKDLLCYMRLLLNPSDNISFVRVINEPSRGIGKSSLAGLSELSLQFDLPLYKTIPRVQGKRKAHKALHEFHQWFEAIRIEIENWELPDIAEHIIEKSGYVKALESEQTIESQARIENIEELLRSIDEFAQSESNVLSDYLERVSLMTEGERNQSQADAINLMTIHNSKGLEYEAVLLVGMEESIFPHSRSLESGDPQEIEEERRLCYVAMTRAKRSLFLCSAQRRHLYRNTQFNPCSRFVKEIPERLLIDRSQSQALESELGSAMFASQASSMSETVYQVQRSAAASPYREGRSVLHPKFGQGIVRQVEGASDNLKLTIAFEDVGIKKIMLNYCPLELLDS